MQRFKLGLAVLAVLATGVVPAAGKAVRSWAILHGEDASIHNGSMEDLARVRKLAGSSSEDLVWFRHGGREYLIRDPGVVREAQALLAPQMELGAQQGELGSQQGKLGAEQGHLGARQGELGARLGRLAAKRALGDDSAELEREQRRIEAEMERLGREMERLGESMEPLGEQMEALGEAMEREGERIDKELGALFDRALDSGLAQPLR